MNKPELLAPAGSMEALKAAVYAGADAVYLGGKLFNARAFADNFDDEGFKTALDFCRLYGVKLYLTLNTLLTDKELEKAVKYVGYLEGNCPPDGYIIQDIGLIKALKAVFPDLTIHASTQMQQHSSDCCDLLKSMGVSRVVIAREADEGDIAAVVKTGIETEVFVHGAVCVCQSGGCLMSSAIGGRSGNRGQCAQPCRQPYNGSYPLSLKDMCLADHIPTLIKLGVSCLKIEGRMKSPQYVYQTVKIYRRLLDENRAATRAEKQLLSHTFSRSGFSDGYFTGRIGKDMFGVRTEADKLNSRSLDVPIEERKIPVKIQCVIKANIPAYIKAQALGAEYECYGPIPDMAINRPLSMEDLKSRLAKCGGTPFNPEVESLVDDGLILPISAINQFRREALEGLADKIRNKNKPLKHTSPFAIKDRGSNLSALKPYYIARFEGKAPNEKVLSEAFRVCDRVELPLWQALPSVVDKEKVALVLPRIITEKDRDVISQKIEQAKGLGINKFVLSNIAHLALCVEGELYGDYSLNLTNSQTAKALAALGFSALTVSPELPPTFLSEPCSVGEYIVYGKLPVMHTANCIIANVEKCHGDGVCTAYLKDKTGARFAMIREYGHRNTIYNSVPTYLLDKTEQLKGIVGYKMLFTDESESEIINVFKNLKAAPTGKFTRGALKREGGVFK